MLVVGLLGLASIYLYAKIRFKSPVELSVSQAQLLYDIILDDIEQGIQVPNDFEKIGKQKKIKKEDLQDYWSNDYIIHKGNNYFHIVSAGPDGNLNTDDDIVFPKD
ncbi:hypothetical protein ACFL54_06085 [Planctomycetota bacterium]